MAKSRKRRTAPKGKPGRRKASATRPTYSELRAWRYTVRAGNFPLAAEEMGLRPATVQLLVRRLDTKVARLLGRDARLYTYDADSRTVRPTEEIGRKLFLWADAAVADIDGAEAFIRGLDAADASLTVAAMLALWEHRLLGEVAALRATHPSLELKMLARPSASSLRHLRAHDCHVAFVAASAFDPSEFPERVCACDFATYETELLVPASSALAADREFARRLEQARAGDGPSRRAVLEAVLAQGRLLAPGRWSAFRRALDALFEASGVPLPDDQVAEFDVGHSIVKAVAHGLGVAIQQSLVLDAALEPEPGRPHQPSAVQRLSLKGLMPDWQIQAVWDPLYMTAPAWDLLRRTCGVERPPDARLG